LLSTQLSVEKLIPIIQSTSIRWIYQKTVGIIL
jgi:hypothetical protein